MEEKSQKNSQTDKFSKSALWGIALELGFIIAFPVVLLGLLGKWIDGKIGSEPWLTIAGVFLAIVWTTAWIYQKFKNYLGPSGKG